MTPRVREVLDFLHQHDLSPFSAFGPPRRDSVRPFVGGGVVTREEFRAVMDDYYPQQPVTLDSRNRLLKAAARYQE